MARRKLPLWFRLLMAATAPLLLGGLIWFFGIGFRRDLLERLNAPVGVAGWDVDGLRFADGRTLPLPEVQGAPAAPGPYFRAATAWGVEVAPAGRAIGLLPIHHWCGNDPVRRRLARVDLARLLIFAGEAVPLHPLSPDAADWGPRPDPLESWGMRVGDYDRFSRWTQGIDGGGFPLFAPEACD